jgi:5-hydroxyisourate hydrolase
VEIADTDLQVSHGSEDSVASGPEHSRPTISTHVLDTEAGGPAAGVHVTLYKLGEDDRPIRLTQALTDADGRVRDLLDRPMAPGDYRLEFDLDLEHALDVDREAAPVARFFRRLSVDLRVDDVSRSYHVPLLVSSFALTTYRGS